MSDLLDKTAAPVAAYFNAINHADAAAWVACFAPEGFAEDPIGSTPVRGEKALRAFFDALAGLFERLRMTPEDVFTVGEHTAVHWRCIGLGKNGRAVHFEGIDVFRFDAQGRVLSVKGYWDSAALVTELSE